VRTTETFTAAVEMIEQPTKPPTTRWEVWIESGARYRLLSDQHLRLTADELEARPLRAGYGRLVVTRVETGA
jgi:hypothetical protein